MNIINYLITKSVVVEIFFNLLYNFIRYSTSTWIENLNVENLFKEYFNWHNNFYFLLTKLVLTSFQMTFMSNEVQLKYSFFQI